MAPVQGLCFTGPDLTESFQLDDSEPKAAVACRNVCCGLGSCAAFVVTVTGSPCLGNTTSGTKTCCYLKGLPVPPSIWRPFCTGNTKNGTMLLG